MEAAVKAVVYGAEAALISRRLCVDRGKRGIGATAMAREGTVTGILTSSWRAGVFGLFSLVVWLSPAAAQTPSWIVPELLQAAKAEGTLTVYSSMNEQEGLPLWKKFEDATGIKTEYVRSNNNALITRKALERRAQQKSWDVVVITVVSRLPQDYLEPIDPPQAKDIKPQARDPNRRWYGVYANYNAPAYNTKLVKAED